MGIRAKFFTHILFLVITPIVVSIAIFSYMFSSIVQLIDEDAKLETHVYLLQKTINEHYSIIHESNQFYNTILPYLTEYDLQMYITTTEGEVVFDSRPYVRLQSTSTSIFDRYNHYTISVFYEDNKVATAHIIGSSTTSGIFSVNGKMIIAVITSLGAGVLTFILLIIVFSIFVSRNILTPIEQLNTATTLISEGDYSYHLTYKRTNEIGQLTKAFERMRDSFIKNIKEKEIQEKNRKELIASISHDLRTPLASIQGYVEALQDGIAEDESTKQKYLATIYSKSKQVNRLIDDLFDFSKLDVQQLQMKLQTMDSTFLAEIFLQIEADVLRQERKISMDLNIPSVLIQIDPERLVQVVQNLVNNSIRYIDPDSGKIELRTYKENQMLVIEIKDNGSGIDERDLPYIFDSFYRGEKSRSRAFGGAGLGLAISKAIIEAHGGEITVSSGAGIGTAFFVKLPVCK